MTQLHAGPGRVLVVEDDPTIRDLLCDVVRSHHIEVKPVENGRDALDAAAAEPPDLVLLDLHMPVMDGATFAREYRHRGGTAAIVVLSSCARPADDLAGVDVDRVIEKPVRVEDVDAVLQGSSR